MKIEPDNYNSALEINLNNRFAGFSKVKIRRVKEGFNSDYAIDWPFLDTEYKANFYLNGEKRLNFFIELEFPRKDGLRQILEDAIIGDKIDKSKLLSRPHREYMDGEKKEFYLHTFYEEQKKRETGKECKEKYSLFKDYVDMLEKKGLLRKEKDYYFISCRIKKIPQNPNILINNIIGMLIAPIYNKLEKISKQ